MASGFPRTRRTTAQMLSCADTASVSLHCHTQCQHQKPSLSLNVNLFTSASPSFLYIAPSFNSCEDQSSGDWTHQPAVRAYKSKATDRNSVLITPKKCRRQLKRVQTSAASKHATSYVQAVSARSGLTARKAHTRCKECLGQRQDAGRILQRRTTGLAVGCRFSPMPLWVTARYPSQSARLSFLTNSEER